MYGFHQTFPLRGGNEDWIGKAIRELQKADPELGSALFQDVEQASKELGIGVNKVKSLKEWLKLTGVAENRKDGTKNRLRLTRLGSLIAEYDPYIEETGTLWALHYRLCSKSDGATTWYWFWNEYSETDLTREQALAALTSYSLEQKDAAPKSLQDDLSVLFATYAFQEASDVVPVFGELKLLKETSKGAYRKTPRKQVPPLLLAYIIADQQQQRFPNSLDIGFDNLLRDSCGPGKLMLIDVTILVSTLAKLKDQYEGKLLDVTRTGGLDNVTFRHRIDPLILLKAFYWEKVQNRPLADLLVLFEQAPAVA